MKVYEIITIQLYYLVILMILESDKMVELLWSQYCQISVYEMFKDLSSMLNLVIHAITQNKLLEKFSMCPIMIFYGIF